MEKKQNKKIKSVTIILLALIVGVILIYGTGRSEAPSPFIAEGQEIQHIYITAPLPQYYIDLFLLAEEVLSVEVSEYGSTVVTLNVSGMTEDEAEALMMPILRVTTKFAVLWADNFKDVPGLQQDQAPFACPQDVITQEVSGVYLVDGTLFVDNGDTLGKCPQLD